MQVSVRELRNHTSGVLRRVEAGERAQVTVDRRPVAELVPLPHRSQWVAADKAWAALRESRADPDLRHQLTELLPQRTDEL